MSRSFIGFRRAQRGQALIETALVLPMCLLVLFGILWSIQTEVVAERTQLAVRFSGLVSDQASQYTSYSIFAVYNASLAPALSCTEPTDDVLEQDGTYASGITRDTFFWPYKQSSPACSSSVVVLTGGSLVTPLVFIQTLSQITSYTQTKSALQQALPAITSVFAQQNYLETPDVPHLLDCYPEVDAAVPASLNHAYLGETGPATPLPADPGTSPLTVNTACH